MTQSDVLQQPQAVLEGIGTTPAADAHTTHDERKEKKRKEKKRKNGTFQQSLQESL